MDAIKVVCYDKVKLPRRHTRCNYRGRQQTHSHCLKLIITNTSDQIQMFHCLHSHKSNTLFHCYIDQI